MVYGSLRPLVWTWTTGTNGGGSADVYLLNGDDDSIDGMINVPGPRAALARRGR